MLAFVLLAPGVFALSLSSEFEEGAYNLNGLTSDFQQSPLFQLNTSRGGDTRAIFDRAASVGNQVPEDGNRGAASSNTGITNFDVTPVLTPAEVKKQKQENLQKKNTLVVERQRSIGEFKMNMGEYFLWKETPEQLKSFRGIIEYVLRLLIRLAGLFMFLMIMIEGFQLLTAQKEPAAVKDRIIEIAKGAVLVFGAYVIVTGLLQVLYSFGVFT